MTPMKYVEYYLIEYMGVELWNLGYTNWSNKTILEIDKQSRRIIKRSIKLKIDCTQFYDGTNEYNKEERLEGNVIVNS